MLEDGAVDVPSQTVVLSCDAANGAVGSNLPPWDIVPTEMKTTRREPSGYHLSTLKRLEFMLTNELTARMTLVIALVVGTGFTADCHLPASVIAVLDHMKPALSE